MGTTWNKEGKAHVLPSGQYSGTQKATYPQVGKSVISETKDWLKLLTAYPQLSYHMENYSRNIPHTPHSLIQ